MNNPLFEKKKLLIILFSWEIAGILVSLLMSIPKPSFHTFFDQIYICLTFTNSIAVLGLGLFLLYHRIFKNRGPVIGILIPYILIGCAASVYISLKFAVFCGSYFCGLDHYQVNLWHLLIISVNIIFITSFSLICILYFLHIKLSTNLETKLQENEQLKHLQLESKLSILQSKVNPHFLFNTLNTMLGMVRNQPEKVEKIIFNLSDIYRKVLSLPDNALVKLDDEIQLTSEYLEIEKSRMGERLKYNITAPQNILHVLIPPLSLQILVENAIIHGLTPKKDGGQIDISASQVNGHIIISVTDDGAGLKQDFRNSGYGLYNIEQRLKLVYNGKASLDIKSGASGGTAVTIRIPHGN